MRPDEAIGVIAVSGTIGVAVTWILCRCVYLSIKQCQATSLIRTMMERGYSPQEIIQMLQVLGHRTESLPKVPLDVPPAKPIKQPDYAANY